MRHGLVCWCTGLSGYGKTTVTSAVAADLEAAGYLALVLDGDDLRRRGRQPLGFEPEDIRESNGFAAGLCQQERANYDVVFVAMISPMAVYRESARALLGPAFAEIHFAADLSVVMARDVKGLYAKASRGELTNLIGYSPSHPYEPPTDPDLRIDSGTETVAESIRKLRSFVTGRLM